MLRMSGAALTWFLLLASGASAAEWQVAPGQSIQAAISAAASGDTIHVQPGTYFEALDLGGKALHLLGAGALDTILDASGMGTSAINIPTAVGSSTVGGLTIRGGGGTAVVSGGGVNVAAQTSLLIEACRLENNVLAVGASRGGGVFVDGSVAPALTGPVVWLVVVRGCTFLDNRAGSGGGLYGPAQVEDSAFLSNVAAYGGGGGMYAGIARRVRFEGNQAAWRGGGHYDAQLTDAMEDIFVGNHAQYGGGYYFDGGQPTSSSTASSNLVWRCVFFNNSADFGGGVYALLRPTTISGTNLSFANVTSSVLAYNTATASSPGYHVSTVSGILKVTVQDSTFVRNPVASSSAATLEIVNSIFWDMPAPYSGSIGSAKVSYSDVQWSTVYPGVGNIMADPLFVEALGGDFHITAASPCRAKGATILGADFEGDPRPINSPSDIGADQLHPHIYVTGDSAPGSTAVLKIAGGPGANPLLLFVSLASLEEAIPTPYGDFGLAAPFVPGFPIGLPAIPASGNLALPQNVPASAPMGLNVYLQAFVWASSGVLTNVERLTLE